MPTPFLLHIAARGHHPTLPISGSRDAKKENYYSQAQLSSTRAHPRVTSNKKFVSGIPWERATHTTAATLDACYHIHENAGEPAATTCGGPLHMPLVPTRCFQVSDTESIWNMKCSVSKVSMEGEEG